MKSRQEATAAITLVLFFPSLSVQNAGGWPEDQQWWGGGRTKGELPLEIHARVQRCCFFLHVLIHFFALQAPVRAHVCVNVHYAWPLCCIQAYWFSHPSKGEVQITLKHIRLFAVTQLWFVQFLPEAFQSRVRHLNFFYLNSILLTLNVKAVYFFSEHCRFPKY